LIIKSVLNLRYLQHTLMFSASLSVRIDVSEDEKFLW
jgi:hypothetical protein